MFPQNTGAKRGAWVEGDTVAVKLEVYHWKLDLIWLIFVGEDMTIDDDNSVYVGGLPYDADEESIRRVFDLYGHVVAVKVSPSLSTYTDTNMHIVFVSVRFLQLGFPFV